MRYCLMLEGQEGVSWPEWVAAAQTAERLGFEAIFTPDHYLSEMQERDRGSSDAWTNLAGLAAVTSTIRLGTMVSPVTFRPPAVLAKCAVTVDRISGGRVDLGMGAGWWEEEHRTHGFPFPPNAERFDMLEEQLENVHRLLTDDEVSFVGRHYRLEGAPFAPKAIQLPHPPITRVRDRLDADGRGQDTLTASVMTWCYVGESEIDAMRRVETARERAIRAGRSPDDLEELRATCVVGSAAQAAERISEYAAAGVQRIVLNHELFDDLDMLEVLAEQVFPKVEG